MLWCEDHEGIWRLIRPLAVCKRHLFSESPHQHLTWFELFGDIEKLYIKGILKMDFRRVD